MAVNATPVPIALLLLILCLFISPACSQQHNTSNMSGMPGMDPGHTTVPAGHGFAESTAPPLADARVSEFNHHLTGFFLLLASVFVFAEESLAKRWSLASYVWPMCFLAAGVFVLVFSDAEIWPLGPQTPWYALTHSLEDLQHIVGCVDGFDGLGLIDQDTASCEMKREIIARHVSNVCSGGKSGAAAGAKY